jgi:hypothetical protein
VDAYLERASGEIGRMFFGYKADSYIRAEDFPEAFIELALSCDVKPVLLKNSFFKIRPSGLNAFQLVDVSVKKKLAIIEAEKELCEFFDYY